MNSNEKLLQIIDNFRFVGTSDSEILEAVESILKCDSPDTWVKHDGSSRIEGGRYWVMSSYGVRLATYSPQWSRCFQDQFTSNDEGMSDSKGNVFMVSHYQHIVEPKPPMECAR